MKLLIASVNLREIESAKDYGIHGVITNPTVIASEKKPWKTSVSAVARISKGPFHLQVLSEKYEDILKEVELFSDLLGDRLVVKICITKSGLKAARTLQEKGYRINITGIISPVQAHIAIQAGVDYVSIYTGRIDRLGVDGLKTIEDVRSYIDLHQYHTEIIAASIQGVRHHIGAGFSGAHWAAVPLPIIEQSIFHPVTSTSIANFKKDWSTLFHKD